MGSSPGGRPSPFRVRPALGRAIAQRREARANDRRFVASFHNLNFWIGIILRGIGSLHNYCLRSGKRSHTLDLEASVYDSRWEAADTHMQGAFGRMIGCVALRIASTAVSGASDFSARLPHSANSKGRIASA